MKKRIYLLFLLGLFQCYALTAQKFQPGYIITNQQDTVFGLINNRDFIENSRSCEFKKDANGEVTRYNPFEINAYRFTDGKYYISKQVKMDSITQKVFLEYLIKGKANIYYMRNTKGDFYYIQKENDSLVTLKSEEVYLTYDQTTNKYVASKTATSDHVAQSKKYTGTMKYILRDAPQLYKEIDKSKLDHQSLIKIAKDYHNAVCKDELCTVYEKSNKATIGLGLTSKICSVKYAGAMFGTTESSTDIFNSFGITVIYQMPLSNERVSFRPSLLYDKLKYTNTIKYSNTNVAFVSFYSGYNISIPLLLQYSFVAQRKYNVYFNLGPEVDYTSVKLDNNGLDNNGVFVPLPVININSIYGLAYKGTYIGGSASLGLNFRLLKKIFLDVAANYSLGTRFGDIYRNSMGATISIGYQFNAK